MNQPKEIYKRLLRSFPVKTLKDHFNSDEPNQQAIIRDIGNNQTIPAINDFIYSHFNYSKQHIYFYSNNAQPAINTIDFSALNDFMLIKQRTTGDTHEVFGVYKVSFDAVTVFNGNYAVHEVDFFQPVMIEIRGGYLIFRFTVLETKLGYYFPNNTKVVNATKKVDEKLIISVFMPFFLSHDPEPADLNKGIKHLWHKDVIDSKEVSFRKAVSKSKEVMDENRLVKVEYKEIYDELMNSPLSKAIFRYLVNDDSFCEHFTCDASKGEIAIPIYSKSTSQIENIINEIIRNN